MSLTNQERTTSMFRIYSVAVVADNKERTSEYIEATPLEQLPMLNGPLSQKTDEYSASAADADGQAYEESTTVAASVKAKWRPIGQSNRMTPPDVRRGEEVLLYQFSDSDEYFWDTFNNKVGLRKLETSVAAYSGTKDENDNEPTPDNSYVFTISTHDGQIKVTTSKKNQEPFAYEFFLNTKDGNFILKDDIGNEFYLDSKAKHLKMKNTDDSVLEIIGPVGNWKTNESINMETKTMNIKTTNINIKGERVHEGNSLHKGNVMIQGGLTGTAGAGSDGGATFTGMIRTTMDVQAQNISLVRHIHNGDSGGTTSSPR